MHLSQTKTSKTSSSTRIPTYAELKAAIHWLRNSEKAGGIARLGGPVGDLLESVAENDYIPASFIQDSVELVHQDMCDTSVTFVDALKRHDYLTALGIASKFVNVLSKGADAEETKYVGDYNHTVVSQPSTDVERQIFHQGELDNPYHIDGEPYFRDLTYNTNWGLWRNESGAWMAHPETFECWKVTDQEGSLPTFLADKEPDWVKTRIFKEAARRRARSLNQDVQRSAVEEESQQALNVRLHSPMRSHVQPRDRQSSRLSADVRAPPASPVSIRPLSTAAPSGKVRSVDSEQMTQHSTAIRSRAAGKSQMYEMPREFQKEGYGSRSGPPSTRSTAQPRTFGAASSVGPNETHIHGARKHFWNDPYSTHGMGMPMSQRVDC